MKCPRVLPIGFGLSLTVLFGCYNGGWNAPTVRGSGTVVSQTREVTGFDRVEVHGAGSLTIIQGERESLTIEADDNLLPLIESEVAGGRLKVGPDHVNLRPTRTIRYRLELRVLEELRLSGSVEAQAGALTADQLKLGVSGSGGIEIEALQARSLEGHISGSGSLRGAGAAPELRIHVSGSGDVDMGGLESRTVAIDISGSGDATVWAEDSLDLRVSGSGSVRYYGRPTVSQRVSGSGSVRSLGVKQP